MNQPGLTRISVTILSNLTMVQGVSPNADGVDEGSDANIPRWNTAVPRLSSVPAPYLPPLATPPAVHFRVQRTNQRQKPRKLQIQEKLVMISPSSAAATK